MRVSVVSTSELNLCICLLVFVCEILWQIIEACLYWGLIDSLDKVKKMFSKVSAFINVDKGSRDWAPC